MKYFMGGHLIDSDTTAFHKVLAKPFQAVHLLGGGSTQFEISDEANTNASAVVGQAFHMPTIELILPPSPHEDLPVTRLS